jgi:hypothetical protein
MATFNRGVREGAGAGWECGGVVGEAVDLGMGDSGGRIRIINS